MPSSRLFEPLTLRDLTLKNRIGVSPMCQYSCTDGAPDEWHLVHLGSRAVGGAGLVMTEAAAVSAIGRISPGDAGIWKDEHIEPWRRITSFISSRGAVPGIQLAHAGWKGSTAAPWLGGKAVEQGSGGWTPLGVDGTPFAEGYPNPRRLESSDVEPLNREWREAAERAVEAGFEVVEIHAAHGYLFHSFLSPLTNRRTDGFGGSFDNRTKLLLGVVRTVRAVLPAGMPLFVRLSCTDWTADGWTVEDSTRLATVFRAEGVDLIDCSTGGAAPSVRIPTGPGYQTGFAETIRRESGIPVAAVGMITSPHQAETIVRTGQADLVFLARELLRDPYWPAHAARALGVELDGTTPVQYGRAW